ncbi:MAG TPA: hypothetical protein VHJ20_14675, partial [Polyangia bacterium]|nr:hypothetical protein [Polyangia bacterium]
MTDVVAALSETLSVDEQGAVLALARGDGRASVRLAGEAGARCRAALDALAALDDDARARELAALAATVATPAGVEGVHPGWLRRALENEPAEILGAVSRGAPAALGRAADEILRAREGGPARKVAAAGPAVEE